MAYLCEIEKALTSRTAEAWIELRLFINLRGAK